ncbi:tail fiber domain-containing protein [Vibrio owensii]|uniref:tail fiber domain-containing protein n=1 Tax=Vibrio owensii TaxID=696485 RepID=UPI0040687319
MEKIRTIQGIRYQLKGSDQIEFGFIAQDLQLIYPEMVRDDSQSGYLRVDYRSMIPILLEVIKEQQTLIDMLQSMFDESSNAKLDAK